MPDYLGRLQVGQMLTFEVYLDDTCYQVPSLYLIVAGNDGEAWELAQKLWRESLYHRGVELRREGMRLRGAGTLTPVGHPPGDRSEFTEV